MSNRERLSKYTVLKIETEEICGKLHLSINDVKFIMSAKSISACERFEKWIAGMNPKATLDSLRIEKKRNGKFVIRQCIDDKIYWVKIDEAAMRSFVQTLKFHAKRPESSNNE